MGPVSEPGSMLRVSAAGGGMGVIAGLSYRLLEPFSGLKVATVGAVAAGALAYLILAVVFRVFTTEDLASLPVVGRALSRLSKPRR